MSLLALIKGSRGASGFGFASTAEDVTAGIDLTGKTILITGINSGLGQESGRGGVVEGGGAQDTVAEVHFPCSFHDGFQHAALLVHRNVAVGHPVPGGHGGGGT